MAKKTAAKVEKKPKKAAAPAFTPVKFKDFTISQKRTGKFFVTDAKGKTVNGADKVKVLTESKVMKGSFKKAGGEEASAT